MIPAETGKLSTKWEADQGRRKRPLIPAGIIAHRERNPASVWADFSCRRVEDDPAPLSQQLNMADLELYESLPAAFRRRGAGRSGREIRATIVASLPRRIQQCGRYDRNMAAAPHAQVVPFPSFESNLLVLLESSRALYDGRQSAAIDSMNQLYGRLSRVKGSHRYRELTMYLQQVLITCETGDATVALDSLMSLFVRFISEPLASQLRPESESELIA